MYVDVTSRHVTFLSLNSIVDNSQPILCVLRCSFVFVVAFCALTVLVVRHEAHPACNN